MVFLGIKKLMKPKACGDRRRKRGTTGHGREKIIKLILF
jgi:hypothetical protein